MAFNLYALEPPAQWPAGTLGNKPLYFDCADCKAQEPPIAGIISTDGTYNGIGIIGGDRPTPAMFCGSCFEKRKTG